MFGYYLHTAWLNLRRSPWLTALIVLAIAMGIGSSMTVYSLQRALTRDPLPGRSAQLHAPRFDTFGPANLDLHLRTRVAAGEPDYYMTYKDAIHLRDHGGARRGAVMFGSEMVVRAEQRDARAYKMVVRATDLDFFGMFGLQFREPGQAWSRAENEEGARVAVLSEEQAQRLFGTTHVIGSYLLLNEEPFRIVGVTKPWNPKPRFHDPGFEMTAAYGSPDSIFVPLQAAISLLGEASAPMGPGACPRGPSGVVVLPRNFREGLESECIAFALWVELPGEADRMRYEAFLRDYANEQLRSGRIQWPPLPRLRNVHGTLAAYKLIPDEYRVATLLAFSFLAICMINAAGLLFARLQMRIDDLMLRRALGASRRALFTQCLTETALIGVLGGVSGLVLLGVGFRAQRHMTPGVLGMETLDAHILVLTLVLVVASAVLAGLYPAWRAAFADSTTGRARGRPGRGGRALTVVQLALTLALATNALWIAGLQLHVMRSSGLHEQGLIVFGSIWPREYPDLLERVGRDLSRSRQIPGVLETTASQIPLTAPEGPVAASDAQDAPVEAASIYYVDDRALATWNTKPIDGDWFAPGDIHILASGQSPPKVAVNRALARRYWETGRWPVGKAVGQSLYMQASPDGNGAAARMEVVAVIDGIPGTRLTGSPYSVFLPGIPHSVQVTYMARIDPLRQDAVMREIEQRLLELDPHRALDSALVGEGRSRGVLSFSAIRKLIDLDFRDRIIVLTLTSVLLLLANALGIVGLAWCWMEQRRTQIGIRRALGAQRINILLRFLRENLVLVTAGILPGAVLTVAGNAWLSRQFQVERMPLVVVLAGAVLMLLLSQLAVFWPALRASRLPPALVARSE